MRYSPGARLTTQGVAGQDTSIGRESDFTTTDSTAAQGRTSMNTETIGAPPGTAAGARSRFMNQMTPPTSSTATAAMPMITAGEMRDGCAGLAGFAATGLTSAAGTF